MDKLVSESHYLGQVRYARSQIRIGFGQLTNCFTDDLELAFYRRIHQRRAGIGFAGSRPSVNCAMAVAASRTSQSHARGSRCINDFTGFIDASQNKRVAHTLRLHQIYTQAKQLFKLCLE